MNIANDLRTAPGFEVSTPIKESAVSDPVTVVPVSVNPIAAAPVASATPQSTDVDEVSDFKFPIPIPSPPYSYFTQLVIHQIGSKFLTNI